MINRMSLFVALCILGSAYGQSPKTSFPRMMALDQYLMEREAEIALARSAAPHSISGDADVLILGRHGYETASKGKSGFVCYVERSWMGDSQGPDFWDPRVRGPICFNPPAARSILPVTVRKTEIVLAGASTEQMVDRVKSSLEKKELPAPEVGAMCYMLSRDGWLAGADGHWHPHLMFYLPAGLTWGAGLPGTPILASEVPAEHLTIFMIPVTKWSDGTPDTPHTP